MPKSQVSSDKKSTAAQSLSTALAKLRSSQDVHLTKDELTTLLLVVKVVVAAAVGIACGLIPVTGAAGFAGFFVSYLVASFLAYRSVLQVDEEEYGGHFALIMEDFNIGLPLFMLSWILSYTTKHS